MNLVNKDIFIDTHAHLNFKAFENDFRQVVENAFSNNVKAIINVGSKLENSKKAIEIASLYKSVYAATGFHPIYAKDQKFDEEAFEKLAKEKKVVAIGETGLDYYYDKSSRDLQKEIFEKLLRLARSVSKPVIIHSRDAGEDVLSILMAQRPEPLGVIHCFQGDWQYAKMILDMGLYISFTGLITFSKNYETFEVIKNTPLDRLLIETDCPYMSPEPHRGKRNEPAFVIEVAKKIVEIKKISLEKVAEETSKNAIELFGIQSVK